MEEVREVEDIWKAFLHTFHMRESIFIGLGKIRYSSIYIHLHGARVCASYQTVSRIG